VPDTYKRALLSVRVGLTPDFIFSPDSDWWQILFSVQIEISTNGRLCHHFRHYLLAHLISSALRA